MQPTTIAVKHFRGLYLELDNSSMEEDLLHSPRFPDSPPGVSPDTPLCAAVQWSDQDCSCFRDSECFIVDVTQPVSLPPKKRTLMDFLNLECSVVELTQLILSPLKKKTDYFQPAAAALKQELLYSLQ